MNTLHETYISQTISSEQVSALAADITTFKNKQLWFNWRVIHTNANKKKKAPKYDAEIKTMCDYDNGKKQCKGGETGATYDALLANLDNWKGRV